MKGCCDNVVVAVVVVAAVVIPAPSPLSPSESDQADEQDGENGNRAKEDDPVSEDALGTEVSGQWRRLVTEVLLT